MISRLQREFAPRDEEEVAQPYEIGCSRASAFASSRPRRASLTAWMMFQVDVVALALAVAVAQAFSQSAVGATPSGRFIGDVAVGLTIAVCCVFSVARYEGRLSIRNELEQLLLISGVSFVLTGFIAFWFGENLQRLPVTILWLLFPVLAMVGRSTVRHGLNAAGIWRVRTVLIGPEIACAKALNALQSESRLGYEVVKILDPGTLRQFRISGLGQILEHSGAEFVILAKDPADAPLSGLISSLVREKIPFGVMPHSEGLPVSVWGRALFPGYETTLLIYRNNITRSLPRAAKITLDLLLAAICLVVLSPLFLLIGVAIKMDGGPVFYRHSRIGAQGRVFKCLKFRSMVIDADRVLQDLLDANLQAAGEWAATQKLRDDPRITWVGNLLRKSSLDELPQLLNVLRLEMSLVGPRPIVASEIEKYGEDIAFYYDTRPGLTGLWQVSGRSDTSYERRVQLDTWYVRNWSIRHDFAILAKTVPAVLKRRGAI